MSKLEESCAAMCAEVMIVDTRTPYVVEARASVF